jgi:Uma2 family endonuclease
VLIDPDRVLVECYRRNERDNWELVNPLADLAALTIPDISLNLPSVNLDIPLSQIYEDVVFPDDEAL